MTTTTALAARIRRDAHTRRPIVLIDGGSGSGKTSLAEQLWTELGNEWQLVHLDDAYPGWHGLAAASDAVWQTMLRVADPGYTTWKWQHSTAGPWRALDAGRPILIEGCGSITPESAALSTTSIWIALDEPQRRARALARPTTGHDFADYWQMWAQQERAHWRAHHPRELADVVLRARELRD